MHNKLLAADIAHEKMQHIKDVLSDLQARENNYVYEVESRNENIKILFRKKETNSNL